MTVKKLIDCVLLVDDDEDDNFFHERAISKTGLVARVEKALDGAEALQYLTSDSEGPRPSIIFLDVNMPRMDGFEFLDNYARLPLEVRAEKCVIILSTSASPKDMTRAKNHAAIDCYVTKPLTSETFEKIVAAYWNTKGKTKGETRSLAPAQGINSGTSG